MKGAGPLSRKKVRCSGMRNENAAGTAQVPTPWKISGWEQKEKSTLEADGGSPQTVCIGASTASHYLSCPLEVLFHSSISPSHRCTPLKVTQVVQLVGKFYQFGFMGSIRCMHNLKALSFFRGQTFVICYLRMEKSKGISMRLPPHPPQPPAQPPSVQRHLAAPGGKCQCLPLCHEGGLLAVHPHPLLLPPPVDRTI
ncbi:hypothetical protein E2C01_038602 [Portunus trituberculatus]|uniref:Uncharacterized protein n=1 Tax=Portunus trituberculatus TaxID=210409 RepID=A0A5B7FB86_PORTR|nr:hypothetical protein [Portunus trituberculatus]